MESMGLFLNKLENESYTKYSSIRNFVTVKSGKSIAEVGEGVEVFDTLLDTLSNIGEFIYDNYKSLLDWLATTEIVIDKVVYKTRQNNIRYLQTLNKDNKNLKSKVSFLEVKDFKIPVITGLKCDLQTYVKELATNNYYKVIIDELIYTRQLAEFIIENNGYTTDNRGGKILDIDEIKKRIEVNNGIVKNIKKELTTITDPSRVTDVKPLGKLVKSLSELEKVTEETIKTGRLYTVERLEEINKHYKETNNLLENMLSIMEISKDSKMEHDGASIAVLARYVHSVAELLSFTSMKYYYYSLLVDTLVSIHTALKEYAETKDPNSVAKVLQSFLEGIENSIKNITNIFT